METVTTYKGVPVEELSREELIEALKEAGRMYEELLRDERTFRAMTHVCGIK